MSKPAIVVEGLSKAYRLGAKTGERDYRTLRESLIDLAKAPLRRLRQLGGEAGGGEDDTFWALKDVSFEVQPGEVVGIIGRNGAGKSTLLKILSRITEPTSGRVTLRGRVASLLEVGTGFHPELTGRENIYLNGAILGMKRAEIARKFDEIVAFAEIEKFLDTPVKRYSSGMYVRLAFAVAAHLEPEILVVDEVLAVGDAEFQKKCLGKMQEVARGQGRTVLFVSHNTAAVSNLCSRAVVLNRGQVAFLGSAEEGVNLYAHPMRAETGDMASPGVLFRGEDANGAEFQITRVELLDQQRTPVTSVSTLGGAVFRIFFRSQRAVRCGSVVLKLSTREGACLLLLSTSPDAKIQLPFEGGDQCVECEIESLPLAAGQYVVGAALAVPNVEYLWQREELAVLNVAPRDVYASGLAPTARRCLLATKHRWIVSV